MDSFEKDDVLGDVVELNSFSDDQTFEGGTHDLWATGSSTELNDVDIFDSSPRVSLVRRLEEQAKTAIQTGTFESLELFDSGRSSNARGQADTNSAISTNSIELFDSNTAIERSQATPDSKPALQSYIELFDSKNNAGADNFSPDQIVAGAMKNALIMGDLSGLRNTVERYARSPQDFDPVAKALGKDLEGTGVKVRYTVSPSPLMPTVQDGSRPTTYGTLVLYDREAVNLYTACFGATRGNHAGSCQSVESVLQRLGNQVRNRLAL